jgi:DNA polymerase III subunit chi
MTTTLLFIETRSADKRMALCQQVEQFYEKGRRVVVVTDSTLAAQHLDQLLWAFSQPSFIPHRVVTGPPKTPMAEPIIIVPSPVAIPGYEVLVADSRVTLDFLQHFSTAIHFVLTDDPDQRQESRLLWQAARDQGLHLQHIPQATRGTLQSD